MTNKNKLRFSCLFIIILLTGLSSALVINDVQADTIYSGKDGKLKITIENELDEDIEDVSLTLDLSNVPFITKGSSQETIDEIQDDDSDTFVFTLSAISDAKAGDYNIPYILTYKDSTTIKKGTIGVKIRSKTILDYSASLDNPIIGERSKLSIKIINRGLGEAKFVTIKISPQGYTLLSEEYVYIGKIDSDDFETATFDLILNKNPYLVGTVEYEDLDGEKYLEYLEIPLNSYTEKKAIQLGIKTKNNSLLYVIVIAILVIIWFIIRMIRKSIRKKKSAQRKEE